MRPPIQNRTVIEPYNVRGGVRLADRSNILYSAFQFAVVSLLAVVFLDAVIFNAIFDLHSIFSTSLSNALADLVSKAGQFQHADSTVSHFNTFHIFDTMNNASMVVLAIGPVARREVDRAEDLLAENDRFVEQLTNTIPDMLYVFDYEERALVYQNNQVGSIMGYTKDEISEMGAGLIERLVHPEDLELLPRLLKKYDELKDGEFFEHEYRARHKSGEWRWLRSRDVIFKRTPEGKAAQILAVAHDVTEKRLSNEALLESKERNASILSALPDLLFVHSEDGTFIDYHAHDLSKLLISPDAFLGKKVQDVMPPHVVDGIENAFREAKDTCRPARSEYNIEMNGAESFYEYRVVWSGDQRYFTIVRDITEQRAAGEALAESEARFKAHYRGIPIPTFTWKHDNGEFRLIDYNDDAYCSSNGNVESLLGKTFAERYAANPEIVACMDECYEKKITVEVNMFREVSADGSERLSQMTFVPIPPDMVMLHAEDITKREGTKRALAESEEKYRRIVDTMLEGIWVVDEEFRITFVNSQITSMLRYPEEEMLGRLAYEFVAGKSEQDFEEVRQNRIKGLSEQYDAMLRRKDGKDVWVHVSATPVRDENGNFAGSFAMVTDITERKLAEDALRKSEEHFRLAVEAAEIFSWEIDLVARTFKWAENNSRANRFSLPRTFDEAVANIHADDIATVRETFSKAIKECGEYQVEYRYIRPEDRQEVWHLSAGMLFPDGNGRAARGVGVTQDITEQKRKEEELRFLTARLLNLQDEERRRLARELHDETAQNLAILNVNLSAIRNQLSDRSKAEALITQSEQINQRSLREVRTLSYLLHPPMLDESGLAPALRWFVRGFTDRSGIRVDLVERSAVARLPTDVEMALYRVVQESLTNIHRHSGSPTAQIELKRDLKKVVLTVKDKGRGLPPEILNRKSSALSFGVGLPGMRERLHLLGGRLEIKSSEKGTTLKATIPLKETKQ